MHIDKISENGQSVRISMTNRAKERLPTTCFRRESTIQLAGNFRYWANLAEFFGDNWVHGELLWHIDKLIESKDEGAHSATLVSRWWLGWESTDLLSKYSRISDLEKFNPNRRSRALRVRMDRSKYRKAPPTNRVTVVFEFRLATDVDKHLVIIHSIYPGEDIGELAGDVTDREQRVFFDWNHPGENFPDR